MGPMCGICGASSGANGRAIAAMNAAMVHRGPDDEGQYVDPASAVALGARRLSIIDVEGGHQPLSNEDGTVWVVLNGEIYNHPLLQERLVRSGHRLKTRTDTEVLVHLWEDFGPELVHALEGMFAFAVWDERQRRLLVARDRFGEKPLFYFERDGELWFASELTALLSGAPVDLELDRAAMDAYFVFGYVPGPATLVKGVRQLQPGTLLEWSKGEGVQLRRYWAPPPYERCQTVGLEELTSELHELLLTSVSSRMIADVPLGVSLSGGLDSTLVAAIAARSSSKPVRTFTVTYDLGDVGEGEAARRAAAALGSEHREIVLRRGELAATAVETLARIDQPLADQALLASHAVARLAREDVTVMVGGEGADELFGGYPRYRWLARAEHLASVLPAGLARAASGGLRRMSPAGRARRLADVVEPVDSLERHLDWVTDRRRELRPVLYGALLAETSVSTNGATPAALRELAQGPDLIGSLMMLDQQHWLPGDVLPKVDRAGMLTSLEIRTPYLHYEIAELSAVLPAREHVVDGGKVLLRRLLGRALPGLSLEGPKTAFRVPAADWLRGPLARALSEQVQGGALYRDGWFRVEPVRRLVDEHARGRRDWTHVLWPLFVLGIWLDARQASA
jgi:asparagine synthase (glutamine-hydrolysing)